MAAKKTASKKTAAKKAAGKSTAEKSATPEPAKPAKKATARKTAPKKPEKPALPEGALMAVHAARFADDMKAEDVVVLDVSEVSSITDYFVICSGSSVPHLKAIVREVRAHMTEAHGVKPGSTDGQTESQWLVLDYGILMFHAFHPEKRELYALEDLWNDAKRLDWKALA